MVRSFFIAAAMVLGLQARANTINTQFQVEALTNAVVHSLVKPMLFGPFTVGDSCDYNMNGGFIQGTAHMFVREQTSQGFWVETDVDAGMFGKQKIEVLYDNSGHILKMLVNGQEQTPPDPSQEKVVQMKKDHISVPAFSQGVDCMYIKIHDNSKNTDSDVWVTREVPMGGMIKTVSPAPMVGTMTLELTKYSKH